MVLRWLKTSLSFIFDANRAADIGIMCLQSQILLRGVMQSQLKILNI